MKRYLHKQGEFFIAIMATIVTGLLAAWLALPIKAALPLSAIAERLIDTLLTLIISICAIMEIAFRVGREKRTFSLRFNAVNGIVFTVWHFVFAWVCQAAWFSAGFLHFEVADWLCWALEMQEPQGKTFPLGFYMLGVLVVDALIIVPLTTLGNYLGARKHRIEVQKMQEDHARRMAKQGITEREETV